MSYFRRLLPPNPRLSPSDPGERQRMEAALDSLARSMVTLEGTAIPAERNPDPLDRDNNFLAPAGYTYFGQFVDHDLTQDETPLAQANPDVEHTPNLRRARLGLDQLYGAGPLGSPHLYDLGSPPGEERFLLRQTLSGRLVRDLPRDPQTGEVLTGDGRREENLLLTQITVAFARFHNAVLARVKLPAAGGLADALPAGLTPFERARRLVTWHYQALVVNAFLPQILGERTLQRLRRDGPGQLFQALPGRSFEVSVEFALAGFRYGHTAVRNSYEVNAAIPHAPNSVHRVLLAQLLDPAQFLSSQPGVDHRPDYRLRDEWVVDWGFFFEMPPRGGDAALRHVRSARLDTRIASALHDLPMSFQAPNSPRLALPLRTLLRGARVGLPSGQELAAALGEEPLTEAEILGGLINVDPKIITGPNFHRETPLFYYLLKEAEVRGERRRLGPVGGRLVGETIHAALLADPDSYVNQAPGGYRWQPTYGTPSRFGMDHLLAAAGVASPTEDGSPPMV